jgi:hypothetical protein
MVKPNTFKLVSSFVKLILLLSVASGFPSQAFAQPSDRQFQTFFQSWQDWHDQLVVERLFCKNDWQSEDGTSGTVEIRRDRNVQRAMSRTQIATGRVQKKSVEILNSDYMAKLDMGLRNQWVISELVVRKTNPDRFRLEVEDAAERFESLMGSGLYYLQVPGIISSVSLVPAFENAFLLKLNPDGYPDIRKFRPRPDQMMIIFHSTGLPKEVRMHCTGGDFNFGYKNGYDMRDGQLRKIWNEEYSGFESLVDGELKGFEIRSEFIIYKNLDSTDELHFRLPYYGHAEPVIPPWWRIHQTKLLLLIVILILFSGAIFLKRLAAVSDA